MRAQGGEQMTRSLPRNWGELTMSLRAWRRNPGALTLAGELRKLEQEAGRRLAAGDETYSRVNLARVSGVPERTLGAWLDGSRVPRDLGELMGVVQALASWAEQPSPLRHEWARLRDAARGGGLKVARSHSQQ